MSHHCTDEPVSWLRLEQYALGELPPHLHRDVSVHLARCATCRACLAQIQDEASMVLPPLPAVSVRVSGPPRRTVFRQLSSARWRTMGVAAALAAVAILMLPLTSNQTAHRTALPASSVRLKGGELRIDLVRERDGSIAHDAHVFAPSDRFKVTLSCPPSGILHWDVAVIQGGAVSFPLAGGTTSCGNGLVLPGAFHVTGTQPAAVCVILEAQAPERLRWNERAIADANGMVACQQLQPIANDPL